MFQQDFLKGAEQNKEEWEKKVKEIYERKMGHDLSQLKTNSNIPLEYAYGPQDLQGKDENIKMPGTYPYTRGLYPLTYQYTPWMTQFLHGYGLPDHTRQRTDKLVKEGMTGTKGVIAFNVECDLATSHGYDKEYFTLQNQYSESCPVIIGLIKLRMLWIGFRSEFIALIIY